MPYAEADPEPLHMVTPLRLSDNMSGQTRGVEISAKWLALNWWRMNVNYSYLHTNLHVPRTSQEIFSATGTSPAHQVSLTSSMDLPGRIELDSTLHYVSKLPNLSVNVPAM